MSETFTAVIFIVIGIVFKIVFDWAYRVTNNVGESGYTKTFKRGDCEDTITFNPTETIIKLEIDWDRYDPFDPHMEAITKMIELVWSGDNGTPLRFLKELEESESKKNQRLSIADQEIVNFLKKIIEVEDERNDIRSKFDRLKTAINDALIDPNEPPF